MSYIKVVAMGRLVRAVELKQVGDKQTSLAEITVACDVSFGEKKQTTFIDVKVWGKQAEFVEKYFRKGDGIMLDGSLKQEEWESKDGGKRSKHVINAENIRFPPGQTKNSDAPAVEKAEIDEIPF